MDHDIHAIADFVLDRATLSNGLDFHSIRPSIQGYFERQGSGARGKQIVEDDLLRAVARRLVVAPDFRVESEGDELQTSTAQVLCDSADLSKSFEDLRLVPSEDRLWRTLCGHDINYRLMTREEFTMLVEIAKAGPGGILQRSISDVTGEHMRAVGFRTNSLMRNGYVVKVDCRYPADSLSKTCRMWHSRFKADAAAFAKQEQDRESARRHANQVAAATRAQAYHQATRPLSQHSNDGSTDYAKHQSQTSLDRRSSIDPRKDPSPGDASSYTQPSYSSQRKTGHPQAKSYTKPPAQIPIAPRPLNVPVNMLPSEASSSAPSRQLVTNTGHSESYSGYPMHQNGYMSHLTPAFAHTPGRDYPSPHQGSPFMADSTSFQPGPHVRRSPSSATIRPDEHLASLHVQNSGLYAHSATVSPSPQVQPSSSPKGHLAVFGSGQEPSVSHDRQQSSLQPQAQGRALRPDGHQSASNLTNGHREITPTTPPPNQPPTMNHTASRESSPAPRGNDQHQVDEQATPGNRKRKMSYRAQAAALVKKRKLDMEAAQKSDQSPIEDDLYVTRSLALPTPSCRVFRPKKYIEQAGEVIRGRPLKKLILVFKSAKLVNDETFRSAALGQTNAQDSRPTEPHAHSSRVQPLSQDSNNLFAYNNHGEVSRQDWGLPSAAARRTDDDITSVARTSTPANELSVPDELTQPPEGNQPDSDTPPAVRKAPPDIPSAAGQSNLAHTTGVQPSLERTSAQKVTMVTPLQSQSNIPSSEAPLKGSTGRVGPHARSNNEHNSLANPMMQTITFESTPSSHPGPDIIRADRLKESQSGTQRTPTVGLDPTLPKYDRHTSSSREGRNPGGRLVLEIIQRASGVYPGEGQIWFPYATAIRKYSSTTPYPKTVDNIVNGLIESGDIISSPFTFKKNGIVVTKHVLSLSRLGGASTKAWVCKEAMIRNHPSKFFPEGPEVDPALVADPHPNRRLLQKTAAAAPAPTAQTASRLSTHGPQQAASHAQTETSGQQPETIHLGKRKRISSDADQRKDRDVSIDPEDVPNEEQTSLQTSFQILQYVHDPRAAPKGSTDVPNGGPTLAATPNRASQNAMTPTLQLTPSQKGNAGSTQPATSASKQRSTVMRAPTFSTKAHQGSARQVEVETSVARGSHAASSIASNKVPKAAHFTWEEDELTKAAFEQDVLREQQERDQPLQGGQASGSALVSPNAWLLSSNKVQRAAGKRICVTLTDPDQPFHPSTGTFSTDFAVWRDTRPRLKIQPGAQSKFEDTLPKDLKEMTRARRMRWLGRATDFERAVDAVAAWEEEHQLRLTSAQSLMTPRFINHFVTNDDNPKPPKAPRLAGDASVTQSGKRANEASLSKTSKVSGRKSMPSNRLMEARDADSLLQPLLQQDSASSSDSSSPTITRPLAVGQTPMPPPRPARVPLRTPSRPDVKWPILSSGTEAFAKYKHTDGILSKDDLATEPVTMRIILAVVVARTLVLNRQGNIHWPAVCRLVPDCGRDGAHNRWIQLKVSQEKLITKCQHLFEREYLVACDQGELPIIDYEDVESYCWDRLLGWALNKVKEAGMSLVDSDDMFLPGTREALEEEFLIEPVKPQGPDESSGRLDSKEATPNDTESMSMPRSLDNNAARPQTSKIAVTESDIALTLIRANILTPFQSYNGGSARTRLSVFSNEILTEAIAALKGRGVIQTVNKIAGRLQASSAENSSSHSKPTPVPPIQLQKPGDPRIYIADPAFVNMLDNAHGDSWSPSMLHEAAAYKLSLDAAFSPDLQGHAEAPSTPSAGQMMVLTTLRDTNEITATPIVVPSQQYDGKIPMPHIRFRPTERYQLGLSPGIVYGISLPSGRRDEYRLLPPDPHLSFEKVETQIFSYENGDIVRHDSHPRKRTPTQYGVVYGTKERRIPLWYTVNDVLMPELFKKMVTLVLHVIVMGDGVGIGEMIKGLRGKVEVWDVEMVLGWLMERKVIVEEKRDGGKVVYRPDGMWWAVLGAGDGKAS